MFVVPSRGRPHNIPRLFFGTSPACLVLDEDDPMLGGYLDLQYPEGWEIIIGDRGPLSGLYNRVFGVYPDLDWYGIFADDVTPESPDWDLKLIEAAGSDGMAYGNDGIEAPTHFVLGGDLVRDVGWLAHPGLDRLYIDTVWHDIAEARGVLRYLPDVVVRHRHPSVGLGLMDKTYRKYRKAEDKRIYEAFRESRF